MSQTQQQKRLERPIVFLEKPRCPSCNSADLQTKRSAKNGDASTSRNTTCRACGLKFVIVIE